MNYPYYICRFTYLSSWASSILIVSFSNADLFKRLWMHSNVLLKELSFRSVWFFDSHNGCGAVSLNKLYAWRGRGGAVDLERRSLLIFFMLSCRALLEIFKLFTLNRHSIHLISQILCLPLVFPRTCIDVVLYGPVRRLLAGKAACRGLRPRKVSVSHF